MRFPRTAFWNHPDQCAWLVAMHLLPGEVSVPPFESFQVFGTEERPSKIELYAARRPEYNDAPVAVYVWQGGNFVCTERAVPPRIIEKPKPARSKK